MMRKPIMGRLFLMGIMGVAWGAVVDVVMAAVMGTMVGAVIMVGTMVAAIMVGTMVAAIMVGVMVAVMGAGAMVAAITVIVVGEAVVVAANPKINKLFNPRVFIGDFFLPFCGNSAKVKTEQKEKQCLI